MAAGPKRSWLLAGAVLLCLPLVYVVLERAMARFGWAGAGPLIMLGLWVGAGVAFASIFGLGIGARRGASPASAAPKWVFVVWGLGVAALLARALGLFGASVGAPTGLLPIVQVSFVLAVAMFILATRHRGLGFVIGAILVGAVMIALFSAVTSFLP